MTVALGIPSVMPGCYRSSQIFPVYFWEPSEWYLGHVLSNVLTFPCSCCPFRMSYLPLLLPSVGQRKAMSRSSQNYSAWDVMSLLGPGGGGGGRASMASCWFQGTSLVTQAWKLMARFSENHLKKGSFSFQLNFFLQWGLPTRSRA